jgi:hypothetical protein
MEEPLFTETRKTLVLICGYARAGKDTLGQGIMEWSEKNNYHANFADALKDTCNIFLEMLGIKGDFYDEEFKTKHRDFLVTCAKFARSHDRNVFAEELAEIIADATDDSYVPYETIVTTDWRYLNELTVLQKRLIPMGWRIRTVYIGTRGIKAANAEESESIDEIREIVKFDQEYHFEVNSRNQIMQEGRHLAKQWRL